MEQWQTCDCVRECDKQLLDARVHTGARGGVLDCCLAVIESCWMQGCTEEPGVVCWTIAWLRGG